jgi:hypothetical protein
VHKQHPSNTPAHPTRKRGYASVTARTAASRSSIVPHCNRLSNHRCEHMLSLSNTNRPDQPQQPRPLHPAKRNDTMQPSMHHPQAPLGASPSTLAVAGSVPWFRLTSSKPRSSKPPHTASPAAPLKASPAVWPALGLSDPRLALLTMLLRDRGYLLKPTPNLGPQPLGSIRL